MTDFQKISEAGATITYFDMSAYTTWLRTWATCQYCGKRRMDRARYYGLQDVDDDPEMWITETDCGCRWRQ